MNIIFFGTPQFAVPTLQHLILSSHSVVGVVTQPDRPRGRGQRVTDAPVKALAIAHQIPVLQPVRLRPPDVADALRGWQPDLGVVAAYGRIIPEHLLTIPRFGMINVHASLLPKYRGAAPVHRAIMNGEHETGVTIMRVVKELDAGAMFAKATRPIGSDETSDVVERDLAEIGARLLVTIVHHIAAGTARAEEQDSSQATYADKITREEGLIEWSRPAAVIHNQVRGLYPWPHAHTFADGKRLIVLRTVCGTRLEGLSPASPGTIVGADSSGIHVATGDDPIAIVEVQLEGKRPMPVRDFLSGHHLAVGDRFAQQ